MTALYQAYFWGVQPHFITANHPKSQVELELCNSLQVEGYFKITWQDAQILVISLSSVCFISNPSHSRSNPRNTTADIHLILYTFPPTPESHRPISSHQRFKRRQFRQQQHSQHNRALSTPALSYIRSSSLPPQILPTQFLPPCPLFISQARLLRQKCCQVYSVSEPARWRI